MPRRDVSHLRVRVPRTEAQAWAAAARRAERSLAGLVRVAVREYLAARGTADEVERRRCRRDATS